MRWLIAAGVIVLGGGCADTLGTEEILERAIPTVTAFSTDAQLVAAVQSQNEQQLTLSEIHRRDAGWVAGTESGLVTSVTTGACADRLRSFTAQHPQYRELLLMDNQGALVCASVKPSDYWQGDEEKWIRSFNGGAGATFKDIARFDESTNQTLAQVSVPVRSAGVVIGALTVGVRVD